MENDPRLQVAMDAIGHETCEDCFYSCPKSEEGCCNDLAGDECYCGCEEKARRVLAALDALSGLGGTE